MFRKTALLLARAWESVQSTFEWVFLGTFSFLGIQTSLVQSSGLQHHAGLQNLWHWRSNTVHSERMRQHCLTLPLFPPNALRETFPTSSESWMEECSPPNTPMAASGWATSLGLLSLGERTPHGLTVHTYTTLWNRCMIGDFTLLSHRTLMPKLQWVYAEAPLRWSMWHVFVFLALATLCFFYFTPAGCEIPLWSFRKEGHFTKGCVSKKWNNSGHSRRWAAYTGGMEDNSNVVS